MYETVDCVGNAIRTHSDTCRLPRKNTARNRTQPRCLSPHSIAIHESYFGPLHLSPPLSGNPNVSIYLILKTIPYLNKVGRFVPYVNNYSHLNNLFIWLLLQKKFWLHLKMMHEHESKYVRSPTDLRRMINVLNIRHLVNNISELRCRQNKTL